MTQAGHGCFPKTLRLSWGPLTAGSQHSPPPPLRSRANLPAQFPWYPHVCCTATPFWPTPNLPPARAHPPHLKSTSPATSPCLGLTRLKDQDGTSHPSSCRRPPCRLSQTSPSPVAARVLPLPVFVPCVNPAHSLNISLAPPVFKRDWVFINNTQTGYPEKQSP